MCVTYFMAQSIEGIVPITGHIVLPSREKNAIGIIAVGNRSGRDFF